MAEIETPPDHRPPPPPPGEWATPGSLGVTAASVCGGMCSCIFGFSFTLFLFFPFGIGVGLGFVGVLLMVVGLYLLYWSCQYAQRHSQPV